MRYPSHQQQSDGALGEIIGIDFAQLQPGLVIEHRPGFLLDWREARARALIAGDHAPVLVDPEAAAFAGEGRAAISETWLVSLLVAATTRAFGRVVANLAWENVAFPALARDSDYVLARSEVLSRRDSASRPSQGIVRVSTSGATADGRILCSYERTLLVYCDHHGPHAEAGYF
ncbi:MaoC/PaaZ C-terminal domain-containing protein [Devosia ginsengisoli]|uniref:MaoC/PaaZ C-terminal domain-containing protein n=1 Tax=Devosia ginsengisoli TaxID=400770 RepID=UPI0026F1B3CA|nr:MaoC/PaaZ C-terminal domain-containing protein [Devosia ginsengisoli]MCR6670141.1 MaoC/PaaZ C-terminal domain-containing protein [Devosia ginsengisoli]